MEYSAPYVSQTIRRNTNPRLLQEKKVKNQIIKNPFITKNIIFSHLNLSYINFLKIYIFLFDENSEKKRINKGFFEKPLYYLAGKIFRKNALHEFFIRREFREFDRKNKKNKKFKFKKSFNRKKYKRFFSIFRNKKNKKWKKNIIRIFKARFNKNMPKINHVKSKKVNRKIYLIYKKKNSLHLRPTITKHGLWLINIIKKYERKETKSINLKKLLKNLIILIRLFKLYIKKDEKKKIFYLNLVIQHINKIIFFFKNHILFKKLQIILILFHTLILNFNYKNFYNKINIKLKAMRFLMFQLYSKIITFTIQKTCFVSNKKKVEITYLGMANKHVSASLLLNMLTLQLGDYINYKNIIKNMTRKLQRLAHVEGFRIILSGRLTRKERAAYIIKNHKSIPLSTYNVPIDYATGFKIMKFGCVGIKIYLRLNTKTTPPYWYAFKFNQNL